MPPFARAAVTAGGGGAAAAASVGVATCTGEAEENSRVVIQITNGRRTGSSSSLTPMATIKLEK